MLAQIVLTPDVFVKGINALDPEGNVGILFGLEGSMGYIQAARKKRNFTIVYLAPKYSASKGNNTVNLL